MTYLNFYGLAFNPFDKGIQAEHVYASQDYIQFASRMEYFKSCRGISVTYGEPGSGKTTALRKFAATLNPQLFKIVYLPLASVTVMDFYRHLARGLGLEPRFRKVDMFHQIQEYIANAYLGKHLTPLIIIDEAQLIQPSVLHDLRLLFNFQFDSQNYAMVMLVGQPLLLNILSLQIHIPLRQRIVIHYGFKGLGKDEIHAYLTALLKTAGVLEPLFTPDAEEALAAFSGGIPRKVNYLAEKSLLVGCQKQLRAIDAGIIQLVQDDSELVL